MEQKPANTAAGEQANLAVPGAATSVNDLVDEILGMDKAVRYVAVSRGSDLTMRQRAGLTGASSAESDRYEELLVNPVLLELTRRRGDIDCGGVEYVVVRYGRFFQLVVPVSDGHVSVAFDPTANPIDYVGLVREAVTRQHPSGMASAPRRTTTGSIRHQGGS